MIAVLTLTTKETDEPISEHDKLVKRISEIVAPYWHTGPKEPYEQLEEFEKAFNAFLALNKNIDPELDSMDLYTQIDIYYLMYMAARHAARVERKRAAQSRLYLPAKR